MNTTYRTFGTTDIATVDFFLENCLLLEQLRRHKIVLIKQSQNVDWGFTEIAGFYTLNLMQSTV